MAYAFLTDDFLWGDAPQRLFTLHRV